MSIFIPGNKPMDSIHENISTRPQTDMLYLNWWWPVFTDKHTHTWTDKQTDGRYQVHYLPCFTVDK